jgi:hypothetical protein
MSAQYNVRGTSFGRGTPLPRGRGFDVGGWGRGNAVVAPGRGLGCGGHPGQRRGGRGGAPWNWDNSWFQGASTAPFPPQLVQAPAQATATTTASWTKRKRRKPNTGAAGAAASSAGSFGPAAVSAAVQGAFGLAPLAGPSSMADASAPSSSTGGWRAPSEPVASGSGLPATAPAPSSKGKGWARDEDVEMSVVKDVKDDLSMYDELVQEGIVQALQDAESQISS